MKLHSPICPSFVSESRFTFSRGLYCYLTEQESSRTETSLCILPRASKYLGLEAVLCVYSARHRYLCIVHAYNARRHSRIHDVLNYQFLDNNYPNGPRSLKPQIGYISLSCDVIQCIVWKRRITEF